MRVHSLMDFLCWLFQMKVIARYAVDLFESLTNIHTCSHVAFGLLILVRIIFIGFAYTHKERLITRFMEYK